MMLMNSVAEAAHQLPLTSTTTEKEEDKDKEEEEEREGGWKKRETRSRVRGVLLFVVFALLLRGGRRMLLENGNDGNSLGLLLFEPNG